MLTWWLALCVVHLSSPGPASYLPSLEPGQAYCVVDDLPFSFVLSQLRAHYAAHGAPFEESSILETLRYVFRSGGFAMSDVDGDGDIDPCFFFGSANTSNYVAVSLPQTTQDFLGLADALGFHTPLLIYRALQGPEARAAYCSSNSTMAA